MANPLFKVGESNPYSGIGRPKNATIKSRIESFILRKVSPQKLSKWFDALTESQKLYMLVELLPYVVAKQKDEGLSANDVDRLYEQIQELIKSNGHAAKAV